MRRIFVDLEMQPIYDRKIRPICRCEIIEIGAVMLDESDVEIASFRQYVKPQFAKLTWRIKDLTGINENMLVGADHFETAIEGFANWCMVDGELIEVYAWSDSDLHQVMQEMKLKQHSPSSQLSSVMRAWMDFQKTFDDMTHAKESTSLEKALLYSGVAFDGRKHDALTDARNTASLYVETRDNDEYLERVRKIQESMQEERRGTCIGDMINLEKLKVAIA